jgi:hypothetical protein
MDTLNLDTMTLTINRDKLIILPNDGLALATLKDGAVLLHVKLDASDSVWLQLPPSLAAWLARELPKVTH